jgi:hypothetical protein
LPPQRGFIASEPPKPIKVELQEPSRDFRIERDILALICAVSERCTILWPRNPNDSSSRSLLRESSAIQVWSCIEFAWSLKKSGIDCCCAA